MIGIDLAIVIGVAGGLLAIIPYVGGAVALVSAAAMALLQFGVGAQLALVVGWYLVVQGLEGFVLIPRIVGKSLGMHPVTVIVALMIGGDLLGFLGLLIAVPLAAVVQVFAQDLVALYRESPLVSTADRAGRSRSRRRAPAAYASFARRWRIPSKNSGVSKTARANPAPPTETDEEEASSPFDHPAFLPVLIWGLAIWFGFDGWFNRIPKIEAVDVQPLRLRGARRARHLLHDPVDPRSARARSRKGPSA